MLEMDAYDEPDQDSDLDYEETYSKRSKRRKGAGRVNIVLRFEILFIIKTFVWHFLYCYETK